MFTDRKVGNPIAFSGEFNGKEYEGKGILINVETNNQLQDSHWSPFDGLADEPKNYRIWTFGLNKKGEIIQLSITEDIIPTEKQKNRSDGFWNEVLLKIKQLVETL